LLKVSIITVCFNSASTIKDTIKSVINQTYPNIEYIIIDGKSDDETNNIVESFGNKISIHISEPDHGIYDGLNKGISKASGDIIGILHADDFYAHNTVIEEIVDCFEKYDTDSVYADLDYVNPINTSKIIRHWVSGKYKEGKFLFGWMPPHPTFFVKRAIYDRLGKFNTKLKSAADYELMLRFIHKHNIKTTYLHFVTVKMRAGGMSNKNMANRLRANNEDRLAWELNSIKPYFFTLYLKPLRKIFQYILK
jgi:glycosyltransferase